MEGELNKLKPLIDKCVLCGGCHPDCPTYQLTRYERDSARGKVLLADALLKGDLRPTPELASVFGHCLSCMACTQACPAGADPAKVIIAARGDFFKKTGGLAEKLVFRKILTTTRLMPFLSAFLRMGAALSKFFPRLPGISGFSRDGRQKIFPIFTNARLKDRFPAKIPAKGKRIMSVAYFTGCMADWAFQTDGAAVINILSSAGADVTLVGGEVCCGAPAYFAGDFEAARLSAGKNVGAFAGGGFDFIVTSCATCGSVLREVYPEILPTAESTAFVSKITDFQKLYVETLSANVAIRKKSGEKIRVTYHDPCHLSRGMKVTKEPREILKNLPDVEFVEMKEPDSCCGGAGMFNVKHYSDSLEIGRRKGRNIVECGAQIVVTECPSCQMQLMDITARYSPGVTVLHMADFLSRFAGG
ncbi:MAG: (Fe-S)-binding protein [Nitrospinae bacterium]|nr:(Fe-S)-binding protein [Nitrospinota bacterium]